jgi:hypothetical protein
MIASPNSLSEACKAERESETLASRAKAGKGLERNHASIVCFHAYAGVWKHQQLKTCSLL